MDKNALREAVTAALGTKNAYHLGSDVGCGTPNTPTSEGASMLTSVRDSVVDLIDETDIDDWHHLATTNDVQSLNDNGAVTEIADGAPSVYTARMWAEFLDLAAYNEDPTEFGDIDDMGKAAAICLYQIAERLAMSLLEEAAENYRDAVDEAEADEDEEE